MMARTIHEKFVIASVGVKLYNMGQTTCFFLLLQYIITT